MTAIANSAIAPTFVDSPTKMTDSNKIYVLSSNGHIYAYINGAFNDTGIIYSSSNDNVRFVTIATISSYKTVLPDVDNAPVNTVYGLNFPDDSTEIPSNLPWTTWKGGSLSTLFTYGNGYAEKQILITNDGDMYLRTFSTHWEPWVEINVHSHVRFVTIAHISNYKTVLPDVDNAPVNTVYGLNFPDDSTEIPSNLPWTTWKGGSLSTLFTYGNGYAEKQILITNDGDMYLRTFSTHWEPWTEKNNETHIIDNVKDLIKYLDYNYVMSHPNMTIYLKSGTYDLIAGYGDEWFNSYPSTGYKSSLILANNVRVIGGQNTVIKADYEGTNTYVPEQFSPFETYGSCELTGVQIIAKNVRFCIHSDFSSENPANIRYSNLYLEIDNRNSPTRPGSGAVIGGGFGINDNIVITNCICKGNTLDNDTPTLYYHSSSKEHSKSIIVISNCYLVDGFIKISKLGCSYETSYAICNNNKANKLPELSLLPGYGTKNDIIMFASGNTTNNDEKNYNEVN